MLKLISSIIKPTSGYIRVLGHDTVTENNVVKSITGYVPETPALYESMSIWEYLRFIASVRKVPTGQYEKRATEFLKAFELDETSSDYIGNLSFGTRQKVAIIAALIHDPQVIVLDEAMNGLDPRSSKILKDLLAKVERDNIIEELHREYGDFGSGYPSDPRTIAFLRKCISDKKDVSRIVRREWATWKKLVGGGSQKDLRSDYTSVI